MRGALAVGSLMLVVACTSASAGDTQPRIQFLRVSKVMIMAADGSGQQRSPLPGYAWWTSDGGRVAFEGRGRSRPPLYVADGAGKHRRRVIRLFAGDDCIDPDWSPDGAWLAFTTGCDIDFKDLYVVRRDGTHLRHVLRHTFWSLGPRWSPDGKELLFAGSPPAARGTYALYATNAAGAAPHRISELTFSFYYYINWAWSPDGESIFLVADTNDANRGFELLRISRADGSARQLTPVDMNVRGIDVASSGRIVFQASVGTRDWEIYAINADGTDLQELTDNRGFADSEPQWSPDEQLVAFTSDRDGNDEVYVMNADGTEQRNLSENAAADYAPSWIP